MCYWLLFRQLIQDQFSSVHFSHSVVSDSLWPHESQHARPPFPSPTPGVYSNSCPSSRLCHPAISSYVVPFSSCLQSLPASGSFPVSQLFSWGGQSLGVSASASVLPMILRYLIFILKRISLVILLEADKWQDFYYNCLLTLVHFTVFILKWTYVTSWAWW